MRRRTTTIMTSVMTIMMVVVFFVFVAKQANAAPNPCLAANDVGQDLENANKLRAARAQYTSCAQKTCNATIRTDCEAFLKRVDDKMPTVVIRVVDSRGQDVPTAEVTIDEAPITLDGGTTQIDPGQRVFQARSKSGDVAEQKTLIVLKEKSRSITLKFNVALTQDGSRLKEAPAEPEKPTEPSAPTSKKVKKEEAPFPVAPAILAGVGVVALSAYLVFALNGSSKIEDLKTTCAPKCSDEQIDPAKQDVLFSQVSFGIGIAALAGAAILYFTSTSSSSSSSTKVTGLRRFQNGGIAF